MDMTKLCQEGPQVMIEKRAFGEVKVGDFGRRINKFTLDNGIMSVDVLTYGATISAIRVPDRNGAVEDVVLGFSELEGYESDMNPYFGSTVGRVCNRISNGKIKIHNKEYYISTNIPPHTLHGGFQGLDKKLWESEVVGTRLVLSCTSYHLDNGFPGHLRVKAIFEITHDNELIIEMRAWTTLPTPVNLTNHSYFNLAGHKKGWAGIKEHDVMINADEYTPLDESMIPTGEKKSVTGTLLDLRTINNLGSLIDKNNGYDYNYCINGTDKRLCARVVHKKSGRGMEVYSDQPGMQFYTGNFLNNIKGKDGAVYNKHGGICFETQNFPNAVNIPAFPNSILEPGQEYCHIVTYKFFNEIPT